VAKVCPICQTSNVSSFLSRLNVPVHQNLLLPNQDAARSILRGDLDLIICAQCEFIYNQSFDLEKLSYGENYDNTQNHSQCFEKYLTGLVHDLVYEKCVQNASIVEVGCGKGSFLRQLIEVAEWGNIGIGFDPSYVGPTSDLGGRLKFEKRYYDADCMDHLADVVLCRHVIEHVSDPVSLLRTIRSALKNSPNARLFFETPCVEWILENRVIWDFFYEHCSYFNAHSLATAFRVAGFQVIDIKHIFGGQYLWIEASIGENVKGQDYQPNFLQLAAQFRNAQVNLLSYYQELVKNLSGKGKLAIWGAGAKGVTFVNLVDREHQQIDCAIDVNPGKQGKFIAGAGHPIVSYAEAAERGVTDAILMNPNYFKESESLLKAANSSIKLIGV
jgi:SAM-dependent methyltransferase